MTDDHPKLRDLDAYLEVVRTSTTSKYKARIRYNSGGGSMTIAVGGSVFSAALTALLRLDAL
ncbi:hypothetical protein EKK58_08930 [Candidatus Dependentiae bacterium]|nr:MAG: hypothetical protein EKK58_08930 [Candidatus Dependentiae bacterium]